MPLMSPTSVATTGRRAAMASSTLKGICSVSELNAKRSKPAYSKRGSGRCPVNRTSSAIPSVAAIVSRPLRSAPSPTITRLAGIAFRTEANACSSRPMFFSGRSAATVPITGGASDMSDGAPNRARSTPFGMYRMRRGGSRQVSSAICCNTRDGRTTVLRRNTARRVQIRRGNWPATSSGPSPSSTWTCRARGSRLAIAHSMDPQLDVTSRSGSSARITARHRRMLPNVSRLGRATVGKVTSSPGSNRSRQVVTPSIATMA